MALRVRHVIFITIMEQKRASELVTVRLAKVFQELLRNKNPLLFENNLFKNKNVFWRRSITVLLMCEHSHAFKVPFGQKSVNLSTSNARRQINRAEQRHEVTKVLNTSITRNQELNDSASHQVKFWLREMSSNVI